MLSDERKWEKFQKVMSWTLMACAIGFLFVISGMKFSEGNSVFEMAFFMSGMVLFGVTMILLLLITVILMILDIRELGAGRALFIALKQFFVYLGAAVALVLLTSLARGTGLKIEMAREILLFAVALDIGSYLGKFSKRRLPGT